MLDNKLKEKIYEINDLILLNYSHWETSCRAKFLSSIVNEIDILGIIFESPNPIDNDFLNLSYKDFLSKYESSSIKFIICDKTTGKIISLFGIKISNFEEKNMYTNILYDSLKSCISQKNSNNITTINDLFRIYDTQNIYMYFNNNYKNNSKNQLIVDLLESPYYTATKYIFSIYGFSDNFQYASLISNEPTAILDFFNNKKICVKILDHERYLQEKIQNKNSEIQYFENKIKELIEGKNMLEEELKNDTVKKTILKYCDESLFDNRTLLKELNL